MRNATAKATRKYPDIPIDGEFQFDAAVSPSVARQKCPGSPVAGLCQYLYLP